MERVWDTHRLWAVIIGRNFNRSAIKSNHPIENLLLFVTWQYRYSEQSETEKVDLHRLLSFSSAISYRRYAAWNEWVSTTEVTRNDVEWSCRFCERTTTAHVLKVWGGGEHNRGHIWGYPVSETGFKPVASRMGMSGLQDREKVAHIPTTM
jgi:hypothetical protein